MRPQEIDEPSKGFIFREEGFRNTCEERFLQAGSGGRKRQTSA